MTAIFEKGRNSARSGYIALTAAIIIVVLLSVTALTVGLNSFLGRINILDNSFKERSRALAQGCVEVTLLKLSQNGSYAGNEAIGIGNDECRIISVIGEGQNKIIKVQAQFQEAFTNFWVTVEANDLSLIGREELPSQ